MVELHLIVIWSKALSEKERIINDVGNRLEIVRIYNVNWSEDKFSSNLSRFYGENLPKNSHKEKHCGKDTFCAIIVRDSNPKYETRLTSKGNRIVNVNLFDVKQVYRMWTGGGHKIHATDTYEETRLQLALLFGMDYDTLIEDVEKFSEEKNYNDDLVGAEGWKSFGELFRILNYSCEYVILRNFENLQSQLNSEHPDVDIMVYDKKLAVSVLNGRKTVLSPDRVQYAVKVDDKSINFDIRHVGDNYYDSRWATHILQRKILHERGFFVPNNSDHFYSLLYHALIHKVDVAVDYNTDLARLAENVDLDISNEGLIEVSLLERLLEFMTANGYSFVEPRDLSVFYNIELIKRKVFVSISEQRNRLYFRKSCFGKIRQKARYNLLRIWKFVSNKRGNSCY